VSGPPGQVTFPPFNVGAAEGDWVVKCSTRAPGDQNPANDWKTGAFRVRQEPTQPGWIELDSVDTGSKPVKDGGFLVYDAGTGSIFAAKGYKTTDFCRFDLGAGSWAARAPLPAGVRPRSAKAHAARPTAAAGSYAVKGNNTFEYYRYDAARTRGRP